jgi:hypothetical protein
MKESWPGRSARSRYAYGFMEKEGNTNFVCVLKTGKLFELDIASNALKERDIPFYKQLETSSGLRLAMPFQPSMGPGTWCNILVHPEFADEARRILKNLPIDSSNDPDVWHFRQNKRIKKAWKIFICFILLVGFLYLISGLIKNIV